MAVVAVSAVTPSTIGVAVEEVPIRSILKHRIRNCSLGGTPLLPETVFQVKMEAAGAAQVIAAKVGFPGMEEREQGGKAAILLIAVQALAEAPVIRAGASCCSMWAEIFMQTEELIVPGKQGGLAGMLGSMAVAAEAAAEEEALSTYSIRGPRASPGA